MLLQDKVAIVSGIGPGLGIKLALNAAREGAKAVVLAARTEANLADAEAQVRELARSASPVAVDVSSSGPRIFTLIQMTTRSRKCPGRFKTTEWTYST